MKSTLRHSAPLLGSALLALACAGDPTTEPVPEPILTGETPTERAAAAPGISAEGTHCAEGETAWLSCTSTKSRVLSLCSTTTLRPEWSLYYRFGPLGAPELTYPTSPLSFDDAFSWQSEEVWSGPHGPPPVQHSSLSFMREQVTYTLRMEEGQEMTLNIEVAKGGKLLTTLPCSTNLRGTLETLGREGL